MTAVAEPAAAPPQAAWRNRISQPPVALAAAFTLVYAVLAIARTLRGADMSYDLGIFSEAVKGYAHLSAPVSQIKGEGFNLLGDHWSPILAALAPLWWVWPSPLMLQAVQAALFGGSVGVVADTATRVLGRGGGLALGAAYGLSFGLQHALDAGFHEIAFAVPILAVVMRQLVLDRPERAVWWSLPLVLVKEDMGLTVAAVGVLVAVKWRRIGLGVWTSVSGVSAVWLTVFRLVPWFAPDHQYAYFSKLPGGSLAHMDVGALVLGLVWPVIKWRTLGWTFGVTGFACLRSPLLLVAVPMLVWRFTSANAMYWDTGWHYSAPVMPVVFLAALDGLRRMDDARWAWMQKYGHRLVTGLVGVAVACTVSLPLAVSDLAYRGTYDGGPHAAALDTAQETIPAGAVVSAPNSLLARLAAKDETYWSGDPANDAKRPDWIVVDTTWWRPSNDLVGWAQAGRPGTAYRIVMDRDGVVLLQRQP